MRLNGYSPIGLLSHLLGLSPSSPAVPTPTAFSPVHSVRFLDTTAYFFLFEKKTMKIMSNNCFCQLFLVEVDNPLEDCSHPLLQLAFSRVWLSCPVCCIKVGRVIIPLPNTSSYRDQGIVSIKSFQDVNIYNRWLQQNAAPFSSHVKLYLWL